LFIIGFVLIVLIFVSIFVSLAYKRSAVDKAILANGKVANALIITVQDTGVSRNGHLEILVKLTLEVTTETGSTFNAVTETFVSRVLIPRPGEMVTIKYNPADTAKVVVLTQSDIDAAQASGSKAQNLGIPAGLSDEQSIMYQQHLKNEQILAKGVEAKAKVIEYKDTGIKHENRHPFVELVLEVFPNDGAQPFPAFTKCIVHEIAVVHYQPGCEIFVKYLKDDITKVTAYHS
jgi:hypothetical protein